MDKLLRLKEFIEGSKGIIVITGAGVSKDSGIPTFRGENGLYSKNYYGKSPEYLLSIDALHEKNEITRQFYKEFILTGEYEPNENHYLLKELEDLNLVKGIITQNIDGLHQKAGSKKVINFHGQLGEYYCNYCKKLHTKDDFLNNGYCDCGGGPKPKKMTQKPFIRPSITLYNDFLNPTVVKEADRLTFEGDIILCIGTSLNVPTVTKYIEFTYRQKVIIINKEPTPFDSKADLLFNEDSVGILRQIKQIAIQKASQSNKQV